MNFGDIINKLLHILHIAGGGSDETTTVATFEPFSTTHTPLILDTSTLTSFSGNDRSVSPKFLSTLISSSYSTDHDVQKPKTTLVTGETPETEVYISTAGSTSSDTSGSTSQTKITASVTTHSSEEPRTEDTTLTGRQSTVTGAGSTVTGRTDSTVTGRTGSTVTGETGSTATGEAGSTVTGETGSTVTGETGNTVTGETGSTVTDSGSTDVSPTPTSEPKSKLSRGAVAGIVIGCLLLIAVIASAIVFFIRNRNVPEAQRLRV